MPSEMASFHVSSVPFLPVERCSPWSTSFARNADSNKFTRHYFHYFDDVGVCFLCVHCHVLARLFCSPRISRSESSLFEVSFDLFSRWFCFCPHRPRHVHTSSRLITSCSITSSVQSLVAPLFRRYSVGAIVFLVCFSSNAVSRSLSLSFSPCMPLSFIHAIKLPEDFILIRIVTCDPLYRPITLVLCARQRL